jgi:hypothetical protein
MQPVEHIHRSFKLTILFSKLCRGGRGRGRRRDIEYDADNIRYDDSSKRIYVGFGNGGIGIINAADGKQIGSIKLTAHPEAFELEKQGHRIFVNVPNSRQVAVVDREKGEVIATWKTNGAFGNFPMAFDAHRAFRAGTRQLIRCCPISRFATGRDSRLPDRIICRKLSTNSVCDSPDSKDTIAIAG